MIGRPFFYSQSSQEKNPVFHLFLEKVSLHLHQNADIGFWPLDARLFGERDMTADQDSLLKDFETRVRQLLLLCESLKKENEALKQALADQQETGRQLREELRALTDSYEKLRLAKGLAGEGGDLRAAKQRISRMVREINACIALVNE